MTSMDVKRYAERSWSRRGEGATARRASGEPEFGETVAFTRATFGRGHIGSAGLSV